MSQTYVDFLPQDFPFSDVPIFDSDSKTRVEIPGGNVGRLVGSRFFYDRGLKNFSYTLRQDGHVPPGTENFKVVFAESANRASEELLSAGDYAALSAEDMDKMSYALIGQTKEYLTALRLINLVMVLGRAYGVESAYAKSPPGLLFFCDGMEKKIRLDAKNQLLVVHKSVGEKIILFMGCGGDSRNSVCTGQLKITDEDTALDKMVQFATSVCVDKPGMGLEIDMPTRYEASDGDALAYFGFGQISPIILSLFTNVGASQRENVQHKEFQHCPRLLVGPEFNHRTVDSIDRLLYENTATGGLDGVMRCFVKNEQGTATRANLRGDEPMFLCAYKRRGIQEDLDYATDQKRPKRAEVPDVDDEVRAELVRITGRQSGPGMKTPGEPFKDSIQIVSTMKCMDDRDATTNISGNVYCRHLNQVDVDILFYNITGVKFEDCYPRSKEEGWCRFMYRDGDSQESKDHMKATVKLFTLMSLLNKTFFEGDPNEDPEVSLGKLFDHLVKRVRHKVSAGTNTRGLGNFVIFKPETAPHLFHLTRLLVRALSDGVGFSAVDGNGRLVSFVYCGTETLPEVNLSFTSWNNLGLAFSQRAYKSGACADFRALRKKIAVNFDVVTDIKDEQVKESVRSVLSKHSGCIHEGKTAVAGKPLLAKMKDICGMTKYMISEKGETSRVFTLFPYELYINDDMQETTEINQVEKKWKESLSGVLMDGGWLQKAVELLDMPEVVEPFNKFRLTTAAGSTQGKKNHVSTYFSSCKQTPPCRAKTKSNKGEQLFGMLWSFAMQCIVKVDPHDEDIWDTIQEFLKLNGKATVLSITLDERLGQRNVAVAAQQENEQEVELVVPVSNLLYDCGSHSIWNRTVRIRMYLTKNSTATGADF